MDIDYPGNDINEGCNEKTNTAAECLQLCHETADCKGFTWETTNEHHKCQKACWLKRKMVGKVVVENRLSGFSNFEVNVDYPGNDINNGCAEKTTSAFECLELCIKTADCKGFIWETVNAIHCPKACWLKNKMIGRKEVQHRISGFSDFEINVDYLGKDINNGCYEKTASSSECLDLCHKTADCIGFTWVNPDYPYCPMGCWIKSQITGRVAKQNVISGFAGEK